MISRAKLQAFNWMRTGNHETENGLSQSILMGHGPV